MEAPLVALVDLTAELAKLKTLQGESPQTTRADGDGSLARLAVFRGSNIFASKSSGKTAWERHPDDEEFVLFIEGTATLTIVTDDGPPQSFEVSAGMIAVVPKGAWHRVQYHDGMTLISVTGQTEFLRLDVDDPRTEESQGR